MGTVTILVLSLTNAFLAVLCWRYGHMWLIELEERRRLFRECEAEHKRYETLWDENMALLKQKYEWIERTGKVAAGPQRVLNSAQARKAMERDNADFFSADRKVPNSEVLKEQSNG
jgi:hypothetical protein